MKRYREDTKKRLRCTFLLSMFRITEGTLSDSIIQQ